MYKILEQACQLQCKPKLLQRFSNKSYRYLRNYLPFSVYETKKKLSQLTKTDDRFSSWKVKIESQGLIRLIESFENYGHRVADINPIYSIKNVQRAELLPETYGLHDDKEVQFHDGGPIDIKNIVEHLRSVYCGKISVEFMMMESVEERRWLNDCFYSTLLQPIESQTKRKLCKLLSDSQSLDHFLATKFATLKRYSGEGAESMLVFFDQCLKSLLSHKVQQVVVGMPHRGRNNVLIGLLNYSVETMLRKIKGLSEFPEEAHSIATGDVLSHLSVSTDFKIDDENSIHVSLLPNSSFLESVNSMAMGKCRARQDTLGKEERRGDTTACLLLHGDASFAGQGVVMECFNMSSLPHFNVGGTIHLIVNNQLGFTTPPEHGRSSQYASDVGKMIGCPVIHVNGDDPEHVFKAASIAVQYQRKFRKDIIVDMLCFRRWGHNEMDDPSFTQPLMYDVIENRPSVPDMYASGLVEGNLLDDETLKLWKDEQLQRFNAAFKTCEKSVPPASYLAPGSLWKDMSIPSALHITSWDTGCPDDLLRFIGSKSVEVDEGFDMHSHLKKSHVEGRMSRLTSSSVIDWALAEAFAFGSLLVQGYDVRLSGQDVGRGTFSHRHLALTCQSSGRLHYPLNKLKENQTSFLEIVPSLLSEEAVLGFEYGVSIENPKRLVVWESQFGDFFTGAQIPVDTLVMSGEAKWMLQSGLVLLLPHGYDGAGPEHSSCRIERFLQGTNSSETEADSDNVNVSVCHPTTSAQYFHLLRRQMIRNFRKPLIIASPKILLRYPGAASPMNEFMPGTHFQPVLNDPNIKDISRVGQVIFCSGKHYYALHQERLKRDEGGDKIAIIRIEELCPFPVQQIQQVLSKLSHGVDYIWAQEEPRNMGAWSFVAPRFENILGVKLRYAGRGPLAAPAVGIGVLHQDQVQQVIKDTFQ